MHQTILGYSVHGRPIHCLQGGRGSRRVLLCAAFHGSEWITERLLQRFWACFLQRQDWQNAARIWAVPCVNPDGTALSSGQAAPWELEQAQAISGGFPGFPQTWKANARGVDLNLNFPAKWEEAVICKGLSGPAPQNWPGPAPLSEPESRLMASLADRVRPHVLVTLHAQGEEIYWQFGSIKPTGAEAMGREMERCSGYRLTEVPTESSRAGYKDWFIQKYQRPGFTVECGLGKNPLPISQLDTIYAHVEPILETALLYPL